LHYREACSDPAAVSRLSTVMNGIRLEGQRLVLREWRPDDREAMYRLMGDPRVTRFLSWGALTRAQCRRRLDGFIDGQHCYARTAGRARALLRRAIGRATAPHLACPGGPNCRRSRYHFAVELEGTGPVIGEVGFEWRFRPRALSEAEVGYFLEREFWGHGYASEAALLVIKFAFTTLGADIVTAACDPRNHASEQVMQGCGLRPDPSNSQPAPIVRILTKSQWLDGQHLRAAITL
jgi:RimJ/RimL family protein N-acetyltransferase